MSEPLSTRLLQLTALFLRLGFTAFGGPAAHIAMFHDETVTRRKWLTNEQFTDLLGATNLIPGPNSTEMVFHLGYLRAGYAGMALAGLCFILPATLIVLTLAYIYQQFGELPQVTWLLYGVKPVIIAIILQALWKLGKTALKNRLTIAVSLLIVALYLLGFNEILLLALGGLLVMLIQNRNRLFRQPPTLAWLPLPGLLAQALPQSFDLAGMFLIFLKIGAVLYGSGYVLVAFLRADFVERLGWLTDQQLIDAIAVGQFTPGPLFTTATFIGYLLGGVPAALLATFAIFFPGFVFVALSNPLIPRLRRSPWAGALLDGVNAASLSLMAVVTLQLGWAALIDPWTVFLAIASAVLLFRFQLNSTWLVAGGALAGLAASLFT